MRKNIKGSKLGVLVAGIIFITGSLSGCGTAKSVADDTSGTQKVEAGEIQSKTEETKNTENSSNDQITSNNEDNKEEPAPAEE